MNKYIVTVMERRSYNTSEHEIEAKTAQDAITFAEFNIVQKSTDLHGKPTSWIHKIKVKGEE